MKILSVGVSGLTGTIVFFIDRNDISSVVNGKASATTPNVAFALKDVANEQGMFSALMSIKHDTDGLNGLPDNMIARFKAMPDYAEHPFEEFSDIQLDALPFIAEKAQGIAIPRTLH